MLRRLLHTTPERGNRQSREVNPISFSTTNQTIGFEILFGLGLLASFAFVIMLTQLLRWILRIQSSWFSAISIGLIYIGGLLGASYYLDTVDTVATTDPLPGESRSSHEWNTKIQVAQVYDIVVVRHTPQGCEETILGMDAVFKDFAA